MESEEVIKDNHKAHVGLEFSKSNDRICVCVFQ